MTSPRILIWDIENSPAEGEFWGSPYNTNIIRITKPSETISFAAKWRGDRKVIFRGDYYLADGKTFDPDGGGRVGMVQTARDLLDEADAVVSYNGKRHDSPHMKTSILLDAVHGAGLTPPSPYVEIDLYQVVKRTFRFQANRLQFVSGQLEIGSKVAHEGHGLWVKVGQGDPKAWARFRRYNIGDVNLTERLYDSLLPWIPQSMHPHMGLGSGVDTCGRCGGTDLVRRGYARTTISLYQRYQCNTCGGWSRAKKALDSVDMRGVA